MEKTADGNFYEVSVPKAKEDMRYKFRIYDRQDKFIESTAIPTALAWKFVPEPARL